MRIPPGLSRVATALSIGGLLCGSALAPVARAQPAPPPGAAPPSGDPPARVGRLAVVAGTVSSHAADQTEWQAATVNYPVTTGDAFWTEPGASAEIETGGTHVAMAERTELDIDRLDEQTLATTTPQGEIFLRVRDLAQGDSVNVTTPRAAVAITMPGTYDIAAGDTDHPTRVTVVEGAAHVGGGTLSLNVGPRETATISGTDSFVGAVGPEQDDPFLRAQRDRQRPPPPNAYQLPPAVARMTGAEALDDVGDWTRTPQYGEVWYPPVNPDWVPYRHGHWAYVQPWGWTWVDDAPWGFAPSHYGRWVEIDDRWAWSPVVPSAPLADVPVYAPALVSFVDIAGGVAVGAAVGLGVAAAVGWIPLGPREPYIPPYRASDRYLRAINAPNVTNITTIQNFRDQARGINNFGNRGAITVINGAAMVGSQPVAQHTERVSPQMLAAARPMAEAPVRPTAATMGITPGMARTLNLPPAQPGFSARPAAPGPAARPFGPNGLSPLRASLGAEPPPGARPGTGAAPQVNSPEVGRPDGARPGGLPPLAAPGARPLAPRAGAPGPAILPRTFPGMAAPQGGRALEQPGPFGGPARVPPLVPSPRVQDSARPAEAPRPATPARTAEPLRGQEAARPVEAPHPAVPARPAEPPRAQEAPRAVEAPHPAFPARPAEPLRAQEAPRAVEASRPTAPPRPAEPVRMQESPRPVEVPHPVAAPRPVEVPHPAETRQAAAPPPPRPAEVSRPAEPPRPPVRPAPPREEKRPGQP